MKTITKIIFCYIWYLFRLCSSESQTFEEHGLFVFDGGKKQFRLIKTFSISMPVDDVENNFVVIFTISVSVII
jgi:hypothetical protein